MKKTINFYEFSRWFEQNRPNNFSRVGLQGLFDYLEEYEESTGKSIEFDPITLCSVYSEYENIAEFHLEYDHEDYPDIDSIMDNTLVIELGNEAFIIQQF